MKKSEIRDILIKELADHIQIWLDSKDGEDFYDAEIMPLDDNLAFVMAKSAFETIYKLKDGLHA